ncbi:amino acid ABC transporter membrane protein 2 (PAAT family) [Brevibacterium sanguinis]|uniref:Amino acid ABC transporter membrane protein 2 (PAAT family) n=2 Tax=Brevibacterium TaxID=1696 RepID=A0A366IRN1_9MICO|nr:MULTISPECIES: ectoine/hydroxyectoine ABC transporter permease subunit EhuD [Brevibacterium]RBP67943.1 amino acid ABC transporter membrane protein 2 (PAAT family) [Brevibacterium sanguinis]RBP74640.1 amino acid ABC transporter membrane protein 2 (PAAT family) [Brevibacterium celere]
MIWNWDFAAEALPLLLRGFGNTLIATVVGTIIAAILGLVIAVAIRGLPRSVNWIVRLLQAFIRNTPLVVQLLFIYYLFAGIPGLVDVPALVIGIIVIGVHYATYMSESYRAGIDAVPPGQREAAIALSLPPVRTFTAVILPQALRATIPSLGNYAVAMFKDTPFLFAISVVELVTTAQQFGAAKFAYTEAFTLAGLIFLAASYPTSLLIQRLERRLATY